MSTSVQNAAVIPGFETDLDSLLVLSPRGQDLLLRDARTANTSSDGPISQEQVTAIDDLARWAPTSMNNQPYVSCWALAAGPRPARPDNRGRPARQRPLPPPGGHPGG
jgi:hypothetical protein